MNDNVKAIFKKYGENTFRLGVTHLFTILKILMLKRYVKK